VTRELVAIVDQMEVGRVTQGRDGRLAFVYAEAWRTTSDSFPISLSLPLAASRHPDEPVQAFLAGLLPDNERILEAWGRRFGVSARNPFALLAAVGEECAGAVQFVSPDRVDALLKPGRARVTWLSEADVADRLRTLRADHSAWRRSGDAGQFSLTGAQPKTALHLREDRWGIPSGRTPTTHILKPPTGEHDGLAENEHLCLELAAALGLPTARSSVGHFEDEVAIVVERYDRVRTSGGIARVHQEDFCQALGAPPTRKYENEGGPGVARIVGLLREHSRSAADDVATFLDALALNWIIGGTDGHAKNFSVLIGPTGVRLAPLYDVVSALPYPDLSPPRIKLAMKIGGEYLLTKIGRRQWEKLAIELRVDGDRLVARVAWLAERIPAAVREVRRSAERAGLSHPILARLEKDIRSRAAACLSGLAAQASG
jgi:serine/threonine-protein kinase HipA